MHETIIPTHLLLLPLALLLGACTGEASPGAGGSPRAHEAAAAPTEAMEMKLSLSGEPDPQRLAAMGRTVEAHPGVSRSAIRVESDGERSELRFTVAGSSLPAADALIQQLRADFPELASAEIEARQVDPAAAGEGPSEEVLRQAKAVEDPDEAAEVIREELRAQGVEGDLKVEVADEEGGRRVEVRVEQEQERPQ